VLSPYEVWRLWVKGYSSYWAATVFILRVTATFTFDLLTPKSIGVFYSKRAIILWSLKALGQRVLELLSGNGFHSSGHCALDLWPTDPKINRGFQLNKSYHPMKFEGLTCSSKGTRVFERKRFSLFGSLWPWPTDHKINRGLLLNKGYHPMKFEGSGSTGTQVIERQRFSLFGSLWPWPLTYWPRIQYGFSTQ